MPSPASSSIPIIILAAGNSARMRGADKLLEKIDGVALLRRQAIAARKATKGAVLVALPPEPNQRYAELHGLDVTPLPVPDAAKGMSFSLRAGIAALPPESFAAMILLADLPELTSDDLKTVLHAARRDEKTQIWRGTSADGKPGHPIVFAASLFKPLSEISGDTGGASVIAAHKDLTEFVRLPDHHATRDLDTPEDWHAWRQGREKT